MSLSRSTRLFVFFFFLCALFALLPGCTKGAAPQQGQPAPGISCNDVSDDYFTLSRLKGKVVVLFFWSSKCCSEKVKLLGPFYDSYKDKGISVVAVEVGGSKEAVATFAKDNHLTFVNLTDEYDTISRTYRVIGYPTVFLIDKSGVIQKKISGEVDNQQLTKLVLPLL